MTLRTQIVFSRTPSRDSQFGRDAAQGEGELLDRYDLLATQYENAFRQLGMDVICLEAPSIYITQEALEVLGVTASSPHVAVRPIADFRPVHGLANYVVFDGPITELDRDVRSSLRSGLQILSSASGVFCTNSVLTDALVARRLSNATTLVPPISAQSTFELDGFAARLRAEAVTS